MKKSVLALMMALCLSGMAFGLDLFGLPLSVGGGISFGPEWYTSKASLAGVVNGYSDFYFNVGPQIFFDAHYVQIGVGYTANLLQNTTPTVLGVVGTAVEGGQARRDYVNLSLALKYPVNLNVITISPIIGLGWDICVGGVDKDGKAIDYAALPDLAGKPKNAGYYNKLFVNVGVSADYYVVKNVYIRPQILVGFPVVSPSDEDAKAAALKVPSTSYSSSDIKLDCSVLVGYKL